LSQQLAPTKIDIGLLTRLRAHLSLRAQKTFTADTLYKIGLVQLLPEPHNRTVGAWFQKMQREGLIEKTGERVASKRSPCHGRSIAVWRLKV
jgi:hypothetical protein